MMTKKLILTLLFSVLLFGITLNRSDAGLIVNLSDPSGLSAEVEFTLINSTTLEVRTKNTSTGVPSGFSNSDQILTSVSWNFEGATTITGGSVIMGPSSTAINFDTAPPISGDVSGEYGYGDEGDNGDLLPDFISANESHTTPFGGSNLDGPSSLNGPQGGLVPSPGPIVGLGGNLGAIQDEWIATVTLSGSVTDLNFLANGVIVEYGSDAAFISTTPTVVPEPSTWLLLVLGAISLTAIRRKRCAHN